MDNHLCFKKENCNQAVTYDDFLFILCFIFYYYILFLIICLIFCCNSAILLNSKNQWLDLFYINSSFKYLKSMRQLKILNALWPFFFKNINLSSNVLLSVNYFKSPAVYFTYILMYLFTLQIKEILPNLF